MPKNEISTNLLDELQRSLPFAVPETELNAAHALVKRYQHNERILRLLHDYYTALPDALEEAVVRLSELQQRKGVHLFVLICTQHSWLYAVTVDEVALIAEYGQEVPQEILAFFGVDSQEQFQKNCPPAATLPDYPTGEQDLPHYCPVCGVLEGEKHLLGCIVEVCPWCDGQLQSCNCRFEQLDLEEIKTDQQVEDFLELLEEKGRIPFSREQAPRYPGTSQGLDE